MKPKRIISLLVAGCMAVSMVPASAVTAFAAEAGNSVAVTYDSSNNSCGDNLTYELKKNGENEDTYILTISGSGAMYNYTEDEPSPWYDNAEDIIKVVLPDDVKSIGDYAFSDCSNLTSMTIPDNVESIGDCAFSDCSSLTSITIPEKVTSIGKDAFFNCSGITSFEVADANNTFSSDSNGTLYEDTTEGRVLRYYPPAKTDLQAVTIPNNVTSIGDYAFFYCNSLKSVEIPDSVTSIGDGAFNNCENLTSVVIPDSVTSIGADAFGMCKQLKNVKIPDGVAAIENNTFNNCSSLTEITIPDGVTSIGEMAFYNCENLTEITIPDGVSSIGESAFGNCEKLPSIEIPSSVTSIGDSAFYSCKKLTSVTIPVGVTSIGDWTFYNCSGLNSVTIPSGVTSIGEHAFELCTVLTKITIPGSVTTLGDKIFDRSGIKTINYKGTDETIINRLKALKPTGANVTQAHTVTFDNGTVAAAQEVVVPYDETATAPEVPMVNGYKLAGYYADAEHNNEFKFSQQITEDTTVYVKWEKKEPATLEMTAAQGKHKVNEPVEVTVDVAPNDYRSEIFTGKVVLSYDGDVEAVAVNGNKLEKKEYTIQELYQNFSQSNLGMNAKLTVTYNKSGSHNFKIELKDNADNVLCDDTVTIEIDKEEEKPQPNPDDAKKDDTKPENPVTTYALTVKGGTVKVNDKDAVANDGVIAVEKDATVEVTFDKSTLSDAQVFDLWSITPDSVLNAVDPHTETIRFTMPAEKVTIEAMTRDATIESEGPGVLGTAALIGVAGAGAAVVGYQGYMIGTKLYLNSVLPAWAVIPQNRGELAVLLWKDADQPESAENVLYADIDENDTDTQKAARWAVENGLMELLDEDNNPDHFDPAAPVTRWKVIEAWNKAQEMKEA